MFCIFEDFYTSGMQDAEVTKSFCLTKFIIFFLPIRYYAKLKKMEEEREQELASKYRDRVSKCQWWRQGLHSP